MVRSFYAVLASLAMLGVAACNRGANSDTDGGNAGAKLTQDLLDRFADSMQVRYDVIENRPGGCEPRMAADEPCFISTLTLSVPEGMKAGGWELYFSQSDPLAFAESSEFAIERLNGDLHRLTPTKGYQGFAGREKKTVRLFNRGSVMSQSKLMPNYYVAAPGLT